MNKGMLTLGLGVTALAAMAIAPRLSGMVRTEVVALDPQPVETPVIAMTTPPAPVVVAPRAELPSPAPAPVPRAAPMRTPPAPARASTLLLPELDAPVRMAPVAAPHEGSPGIHPIHTPPREQEQAIIDFWDNCPTCGMG